MIYFILILFFGSLISIIFMVGKKLSTLKEGYYDVSAEVSFEIPYLKETKHITIDVLRKFEHESLVVIVKSYIQFSNFIKNKYEKLKDQIKNINIKNYSSSELSKNTEISKFIKIVSVYKHKITEITHKIKEEEKSS